MVWSDEPTDNQIYAVLRLLKWQVSSDEESKIANYLRQNCTRREVSDEMSRLRNLAIEKKLNQKSAFEGEIWEKYERPAEKEKPTEEQVTLICSILKKYVGFTKALIASKWLGQYATKSEVSDEIDRLKELEKDYKANKEECFSGDIWIDYRQAFGEH